MKRIHTICCLNSELNPIEVLVDKNKIKSITANQNKHGVFGSSIIKSLESEKRIKSPMIRQENSSSDAFKTVKWDEALDYISNKTKPIIEEFGAKSSVIFNSIRDINDITDFFQKMLATPNFITIDSIFSQALKSASKSILGCDSDQIGLDLKNCKHLILYGKNIFESIESKSMNEIFDALSNDAKLTYIDPRVTVTSAKSSDYKMIRPGTDLALNYALINVIIKENLYDKDFVDKYVSGFDELTSFIEEYDPKWAEAETGIKAEEIIELAKAASNASPKVIFHPGTRSSSHPNEFYFRRSILILNALLGSIESKGGLYFKKGIDNTQNKGKFNTLCSDISFEDKVKLSCGKEKFPILDENEIASAALPDAIINEDNNLKILFAFGPGIIQNLPDQNNTIKAIKKFDLIVAIDTYYNDLSKYADVILPLSHVLERSEPYLLENNLNPTIYRRLQCIDPENESKAAWFIIKNIIQKLGINISFNSIEDIWNLQLKDIDIKQGDFEENGFVKLSDKDIWYEKDSLKIPTKSGKIELNSNELKDKGVSAFPEYKSLETPLDKFRLIVGYGSALLNEYSVHDSYIQSIKPEQKVWINRNRAKELQIEDNSLVEINSNAGKLKLNAYVTDMIHPEAVFISAAAGNDQELLVSKIQETILDPVCGSPSLDHTLVSIKIV